MEYTPFELDKRYKKELEEIMAKAEKLDNSNFPKEQPFNNWDKGALLDFLDCCLFNRPGAIIYLYNLYDEVNRGN